MTETPAESLSSPGVAEQIRIVLRALRSLVPLTGTDRRGLVLALAGNLITVLVIADPGRPGGRHPLATTLPAPREDLFRRAARGLPSRHDGHCGRVTRCPRGACRESCPTSCRGDRARPHGRSPGAPAAHGQVHRGRLPPADSHLRRDHRRERRDGHGGRRSYRALPCHQVRPAGGWFPDLGLGPRGVHPGRRAPVLPLLLFLRNWRSISARMGHSQVDKSPASASTSSSG